MTTLVVVPISQPKFKSYQVIRREFFGGDSVKFAAALPTGIAV